MNSLFGLYSELDNDKISGGVYNNYLYPTRLVAKLELKQ